MTKKAISVRDICFVGIFAAIMSVLSQISIPMPYGVPMTLQTFIIPVAGIVLGAKNGTLATIVYVLLGAVGLPVFAGFEGGIGIIFGIRGGFILSFPLLALAAGLGADRQTHKKLSLVLGLIIGALINYICGTLMFSLVADSTLAEAVIACVIPFIPTAILKAILAGIIGLKCRSALEKSSILV